MPGESYLRWALSRVGMAPGVIVTVPFIDRVAASIREAGVETFAVLAAIVALAGPATVLLRSWLRRPRPSNDDDRRPESRT